jgi:hypothetical protein
VEDRVVGVTDGQLFLKMYGRARAYAERGAAVVLLPGEVNGDRCTVSFMWAVSARHREQALSKYDGVRAGYLIEGARETRRLFERDHGLVPS